MEDRLGETQLECCLKKLNSFVFSHLNFDVIGRVFQRAEKFGCPIGIPVSKNGVSAF